MLSVSRAEVVNAYLTEIHEIVTERIQTGARGDREPGTTNKTKKEESKTGSK